MKVFIFLLFACSGVLSRKKVTHTHGENPVIETINGRLEGVRDGTRSGREISKFLGIQYAVINERFRPSVPVSSWNGTKPAKNFGPNCQDVHKHRNEECLYLNVYTHYDGKNKENITLHPVVVYFHGGAFQYNGAESFGHRYLLDEDIVLVTVNYRLGVLGFLSTGCDASPGNYGLKDQVMSLRWVRDNIVAFGGDKDRVTIMGQSAGSASVTYHLVSPMSRGLFSKAIAQSATFLNPRAFTRNPRKYTMKLAECLECPVLNCTHKIMKCLRSLPVESVADLGVKKEVTISFFKDPLAAFGPVKEPPALEDGEEPFLPQSPYELLVNGNVSKVPLLTGITDQEGAYLWTVPLLFLKDKNSVNSREAMQSNFSGVAPIAFYFNESSTPEQRQDIGEKIKEFYFKTKGFDLNDYSHTLPNLVKLYTDRFFGVPQSQFVNLYAKQAPTYSYLYTYNKYPPFSKSKINQTLHNQYKLGATHGAELDMLFSPLFGQRNPNANDPDFQRLSKSILKLWASFITEGKPTATYGSEKIFPPIDPEQELQQYYRLDQDTSLISNPFTASIKFWESLNLSDTDFNNHDHELEVDKENVNE